MGQPVNEYGSPVRLTASGAAKQGMGVLCGIFVASVTGATITIYDGQSASGTLIIGTFTPIAGTFYPIPLNFSSGCFIAITGTADLTAMVA